MKVTLKRPEDVEARTGVVGATTLEVAEGAVTIRADATGALQLPCLRIAPGARLPVVVRLEEFTLRRGTEGEVHVGQLSGGRRVGGVTMVVPTRRRRKR